MKELDMATGRLPNAHEFFLSLSLSIEALDDMTAGAGSIDSSVLGKVTEILGMLLPAVQQVREAGQQLDSWSLMRIVVQHKQFDRVDS